MLATVVKPYSLCDAAEGVSATVEHIECETDTKSQLHHMGVVKGALITVLKQSHLVLVEIGQSRLALPKELGRFIQLNASQN